MIKELMSKDLVVLDTNSDIYTVARIMKEKDIGFIPFCKNNKIVGVLTDRDIVTKILANKGSKIAGYLSTNIIKISYDASVDEALDIMKKHKIKRLLVEEDKKLVGILSLSDLIYHDEKNLIKTLQNIYAINKNSDYYDVKVNEFEL